MLNVRPRITAHGDVDLTINVELSDLAGSGVGGNPIFSRRQVRSQVQLQDGETVLIGGLLKESENEQEKKERVSEDMRKLADLKLDLIKRREMKLADLAIENVNKQNPEQNAVEESEKEFMQEMCKIIEKHRNEAMSNEGNVKNEEEPEAEVVEEKEEPEAEVVEDEIDDYLLVKVLDAIPAFIGMDSKSYTLEKNDILHLPKYNARLLMDAGKIERMEKI